MTRHPDEGISPVYREKMQILAGAIDDLFNGDKKGKDRRICFALLYAPFGGNGGPAAYLSNGERNDVVTMMKRMIARFEGQLMTGRGKA